MIIINMEGRVKSVEAGYPSKTALNILEKLESRSDSSRENCCSFPLGHTAQRCGRLEKTEPDGGRWPQASLLPDYRPFRGSHRPAGSTTAPLTRPGPGSIETQGNL